MEPIHSYHAFGLSVRSDFAFPLWPPGAPPWDVRVVRGDVPERIPGAEGLWEGIFEGTRGRCLLRYPSVGRVLVEGGDCVTVEPSPHWEPRDLASVLAGTGFAALLYQRGRLCLHASAVVWKERAYLVLGASGAGKSTAASALVVRGCRLISDDVTVITVGGNGAYCATSGFPTVRLCDDAHEVLGARLNASAERDEVDRKVRLRLGESGGLPPVPIARIVFLMREAALEKPRRDPLVGHERVSALQRSLFRRTMARIVGDPVELAKTSIELAKRVEVFRLSRPDTGFALDELCDLILE